MFLLLVSILDRQNGRKVAVFALQIIPEAEVNIWR